MKKKLLSLILAGTMAFAMAACGSTSGSTSSDSSASSDSSTSSDASASSDSTASTDKTVGIAMPTKSLERWNRDGSYL